MSELYVRPHGWEDRYPSKPGTKNYTPTPKWYKVENALLRDRDWGRLSTGGKVLLITVWCLTAELGLGNVPADPEWLATMAHLPTVDVAELVLAGLVCLTDKAGTLVAEVPGSLWGHDVEGAGTSIAAPGNEHADVQGSSSDPRGLLVMPGELLVMPSKSTPREEQNRVEKSGGFPHTPKASSGSGTLPRQPGAEVWAAYQRHHPRAAFSKPRGELIKRRLADGFTAADLVEAIDGCHACPYNLGENDSGTRYLDIELILRNAGKVEHFQRLHQDAVAGKLGPQQRRGVGAGLLDRAAQLRAEEEQDAEVNGHGVGRGDRLGLPGQGLASGDH